MLYIFHGDNLSKNKNDIANLIKNKNHISIDCKQKAGHYLSEIENQSLFPMYQFIVFENFFSSRDKSKLSGLINRNNKINFVILESKKIPDKNIFNLFDNPKIVYSYKDNPLFKCLNSISEKNNNFSFLKEIKKIHKAKQTELFIYLLKKQLRKKIDSKASLDTYKKLIELDLLNKTGKLSIPKDIAIERLLNIYVKK